MIINKINGFTIIEILVSIFIITIISGILGLGLVNYRKHSIVDIATIEIISLLEEARSSTLASKNAAKYGVHFETSKAILFADPYVPGAAGNKEYIIDSNAQISSYSLTGGGSELVFDRLTGKTPNNGTVTISSVADPSQNKVITIYSTGLVEAN